MKTFLFLCFLLLFSIPIAQASDPAQFSVSLCDYGMCFGKVKTVESLSENIIRFLARTVSSLSVLGIMIGGFLIMTRLDDEGREQGKNIIKYSLLALVVVLGAYVFVSFIQQVFYSFGR